MALVIADSVVESATTTGTGDFTLAGPLTGFRAFSDVCTTNDIAYYMIEAVDGSGDRTGDWEVGRGTYSAANTLTRTSVTASSNAGAAVNFAAGTKRVSLVLAAKQAQFRGCMAYKSADQTTANYTTPTAVTWDAEVYDTDSIHDNVTNTSRMTVPAGVTKVRVGATLALGVVTADNYAVGTITKNGATFVGAPNSAQESGTTSPTVTLASGVLAVTAGDYFETLLQLESDTSITVSAATSCFWMEIIE